MLPIRALPWWTSGATSFVSNLLKWYPSFIGRNCTAFEVGSGNSTLFLLNNGVRVTCVDDDEKYATFITKTASAAGYKTQITDDLRAVNNCNDLTIVLTEPYSKQIPGTRFQSLDVDSHNLQHDFLINDGIERTFFIRKFRECKNSFIIQDNCENAANWGRLSRASAKKMLVEEYRSFLRDPDWNKVSFEQVEGRNGRSVPDAAGWEAPGRWITTISWHKESDAHQLMLTDIGLPLTNSHGIGDIDLESLEDRCPFDWHKMEWQNQDEYPRSLDLGLDRNYG